MADAFIIDACRTPRGIGKVGKAALAHIHPQCLAATTPKAIARWAEWPRLSSLNGYKFRLKMGC